MPPLVLDLRSREDSRDVIHRAVQALAEGKVVAFPTETVYGLAVSALSEDAVARLSTVRPSAPGQPLTLAMKSADEALDYVPDLEPLGQRLARRCWPGPVTLTVKDTHADSLLRQLSTKVQKSVAPGGAVSLRVPAHRAVQDVLQLLAGPIVLASAGSERADAVTAQQVVEFLEDQVQLVLDDGHSRFGQPASVVEIASGNLRLVHPGVVSEQTLRRLAKAIVLFVCTGNTCRSPMAETMFRKYMADRLSCTVDEVEDRGVIVQSAGIAAMMGGRPTTEAVQVMAQLGLDLSGHQSQPLSELLVRHADLILTMTRSHRHAILAEWPEAADRVQLVCHDGSDVPDPVGAPLEQYRRCASQLEGELAQWAQEIQL